MPFTPAKMISNNQICALTKRSFVIPNEDLTFFEKISPEFAGIKCPIPSPSLCPEARLQRRMAFRNERNLYRRKSELSGKDLLSVFAPDSPYKVLTFEEWWSDGWDPMAYGRDFDPRRRFFDQLRELCLDVPHLPLNRRDAENSEYTNFALNMKDCYLVFGASHCESSLHSRLIHKTKDVLDCMTLVNSELCYEGIASENCYNCLFFRNCKNCHDSLFLEECHSCNNCILCVGLHQQSYCILNEYVGKERFEQFRQGLYPLTWKRIAELKEKLSTLSLSTPHRQSHIYNSENCSGDMIVDSKNCNHCFDTINCEDCKYLYWTPKSRDSFDCCFNSPDGVELCYEVCSCLGSRCMGLFLAWNNDQSYYSMECHNNKNIFGCVGLKSKRYCILNKQYSKDDYEQLALQIAQQMTASGDWGEYLSPELSYFGYNETIANEIFPRDRASATSEGWNWRDEQSAPQATVGPRIPDTIDETTDAITAQVLVCEHSGERYKISPLELSFYRKAGIPVPKFAPNTRYRNRLKARNEPRLWKRTCAKSGVEILTTYPPDSPETVYENSVYTKEFF